MSAPAFAWAIEQGRCHKLSTPERMVLVILADRANGKRVCWPAQGTICADTGLSLRAVRNILGRLATKGLVRLEESIGKLTRYHVLRPDEPRQDVPGSRPNGHDKTPAPDAGVNGQTPAPRAATPAPDAGDPGTTCPRTCKEPRKEPEVARASEAGGAASGQRAEAAPSAAPSRPRQNTTWDGPPRREEREPTQAEITANRDRQLRELMAADPNLAALVGSMAGALRHTAPPPGPAP